jgi:hypothetical protein
MPSFGGANVFGTAVTMSTADYPRQYQVNAYFGLNGLEMLDGGARGRVTLVEGILYGSTAAALAGAEATFRSYNDGIARVLVDQFGTSWASVTLDFFRPSGRVQQAPDGSFYRRYLARFLHLA